jgi:hypothetical protein
MFCERFSNSQLALLKNSWAEERRTLIARRAKSLIEDWNRDNPRMKIPNQPTSDATVEDHNLFQEKWLQLEGCWKVNRESFDDILEKAMKIITTVSSSRVQYDAQTDQLLQLHSIAWIHHVILSMRR